MRLTDSVLTASGVVPISTLTLTLRRRSKFCRQRSEPGISILSLRIFFFGEKIVLSNMCAIYLVVLDMLQPCYGFFLDDCILPEVVCEIGVCKNK